MNGVADGPHAPWREKIPDRWERIPGLAAVRENKRRNTGMVEETVLSLSYGRIVIKPPEKLTGLVPESFETYQVMEPGDLVIRTTDLQNDWTSLRVGLVKTSGIITAAYVGLKPTERFSPEFLYYLLHSYDTKKVFYGMGSGLRQNIGFDDFKWLPFICPPRPEQDAIVVYLDDKLEMIDRYLRVKEREIALLEERKRALIHRAVTRGLDPNAKLQPSGIPWLPEIPVGWEIRRFRFCGTIRSGQVDPRKPEHRDKILIAPNHIESGTGTLIAMETAAEQGADSGKYEVSKGEIVYSKIRPNLQKSVISPVDGLCSADMYPIRPSDDLLTDFLNTWMLAQPFTDFVVEASMRVAMPKVNREALADAPVVIPPQDEQRNILEWLRKETEPITTTITRARQQIERMREYRTALIAEAVTGKIDITTAN